MNIFLIFGVTIVNLALIAYSIFFFIKKEDVFNIKHVVVLLIGVLLDFISTILMIIGSSKGLITFHGVLGYSALIGMVLELFNVLRAYRNKIQINTIKWMTRVTYYWWITVYIAGLFLIMGK